MPAADAEDVRAAVLERIEAASIAIAVRSIPLMLEPLRAARLSIQQLKVLSTAVTVEGGATVARLAEMFGVTMASMSNLADRLVSAGMAVRVADPDDLRVRRLQPTDMGRAVVRQVMGSRPELGSDVLSRLTDDELTALEIGLSAVRRSMREASESTVAAQDQDESSSASSS